MLGTFFTISDNMVSDVFGVMANVFEDFKPFFLIITGLFLGFFIVKAILGIFGFGNKNELNEDFDDIEENENW